MLDEGQVNTLLDRVVSHAAASGWLERVNTHEPKVSPGNGLTAAVWVQRITPIPGGLAATSVRLLLMLRLYGSMMAEPQDAIDPNLTAATSALMGAYTSDFTLGGAVRAVDLLGAHGVPLEAIAGYLSFPAAPAKVHRIFDISLPLLVNDVWEQTP